MSDVSKLVGPDNTSYDILSKTTRGIVRATMESTSTSTAFVITAPGINSLYDGATFICKNTIVDSVSGFSINVNNLGAKIAWTSFENVQAATIWSKGKTFIFIFDSTNDRWEIYEGWNTNTDTIDTWTLLNYYSHPVAGVNGIKRNSLFAKLPDGTYTSFFTNAGGTETKTFDVTSEFDLTKIYYVNRSSDVSSGSMLDSNNVWQMSGISIDMRYNFNGVTTSASTSSLEGNKPLYLVCSNAGCTPGYAKLASPYFTQDPSTVTDMKDYIYVLVGYMRNCYLLDLHIYNPSYSCWVDTSSNVHLELYNMWDGYKAYCSGSNSHAEGYNTNASGKCSHAEGIGTKATGSYQHVSGKYNNASASYAEIIGNGTAENVRSNARTLDWDGNETLSGGIYLANNIHFDHCTTPSSPTAYPATMPEPGIMWKEEGYGDKFEIKPRFYGSDSDNRLLFNAANGGASTNPDVETIASLAAKTAGVQLTGTSPCVNQMCTLADVTKSNNDLSANAYMGGYYYDKNAKVTGKMTPIITVDGKTGLEFYAKNFNTSGTDVGNNGFSLYIDKSGTKTVSMDAPWAWLTALGLYPGMKFNFIVWKNNVTIRQSGGDWSCFLLVDNSLYSIAGGGGNHATMTPTLQLLAGTNHSVTQTVTHSTSYSDFKYTCTSNHKWVVLSFSNATGNHSIFTT